LTKLHFDYETRSVLDLKQVGLDNYARHDSTRILMVAWAIDSGPIKQHVWQTDLKPKLSDVDPEFREALLDPGVLKYAWNSSFERTMTHAQFGVWVDYSLWRDPMIYARYLSLPGALEDFAKNMGLPLSVAKMSEGKRLIKLFCKPIKERKKRKKATNEATLFDVSPTSAVATEAKFNTWQTHPNDWEIFKSYCCQDVVAERAAGEFCEKYFPLPETELRGWFLDQKINQAGMPTDDKFAENSVILAEKAKNNAKEEAKRLTGLENPNSRDKTLAWCQAHGYTFNSLRKEPVSIFLSRDDVDPTLRAALALRAESAKTSYTKLKKIRSAIGPDNILRNQFLFMGSARAGRWSGRDVQLHNMARPIKELEDQKALELVRAAIYALDYDAVKKVYPGVITAITSCIRSTFVAPEDMCFDVCDLNAIETRVAAWFCECEPLLQVFRDGRDPYIDFASRMYQIPYEELYRRYKAGDPEAKQMRQVAKSAVLGCVYRLGGGDWIINRYKDRVKGGLWGYSENMGVKMDKETSHRAVEAFRESYKEIKYMWYNLEDAVKKVLTRGGVAELGPNGCVIIGKVTRRGKHPILYIQLPSGRRLHYINAHLETRTRQGKDKDGNPTEYTKEGLVYDGINQITKQWGPIETNGGKELENIVQGIARDVLLHSMFLADERAIDIRGHFHDELATLRRISDPFAPGLTTLKWCMSQAPACMPGFVLTAEGWEGYYYKKG